MFFFWKIWCEKWPFCLIPDEVFIPCNSTLVIFCFLFWQSFDFAVLCILGYFCPVPPLSKTTIIFCHFLLNDALQYGHYYIKNVFTECCDNQIVFVTQEGSFENNMHPHLKNEASNFCYTFCMLQCILLLCTKVFLKKYILYTVLYFVCLSVYLSFRCKWISFVLRKCFQSHLYVLERY